nr:MAG TPA: hypothetical protein [Bacteriophage sp.]
MKNRKFIPYHPRYVKNISALNSYLGMQGMK